ncbi:malto-oligosyltrehalose trehalohydrolase [Nakamurella deserti]|uniref:malto-oligosyltrehalose trehalohydrolase n=1 Tax=Nakamurella deserti TaxID=2164074 RepID=UPI001F0CBF7E|nr:malto-oligosyltrehalose trehalohydrolase [Nakamurella deserti]
MSHGEGLEPVKAGHRSFEVWAPTATTVSVQVDGEVVPMSARADGWWGVEVPHTGAEVDYGFLLDDATEPLVDPRSRRQPHGVHGLSRTFDPTAYAWTDRKWTGRQLAGGLIYELHIGTFTTEGTFGAAIGKLDHLVDIGVSLVEVLPVNGFNGEHNWGYDGVLWYTVQESYGGPAEYQRFVDACHERGLGVIQDVVYNHLGPSGNVLPQFGPYLHDAGASTWGSLLNLDGPDSDPVRDYIIDNAVMWLRDYHVDGLRLDAVHALVDHRAVHLLEELSAEVDALSAHLGRPLTLIAESDLNDPKLITPRAAGGYGLTAQWSDDFHHVLHVALTGERVGYYGDFGSMESIAKVYRSAYFHDGTWSSFRGRAHGRAIDTRTTESWRFVVYAQDHDQIGNRAAGDRLTDTLGARDLTIAAVMVLTAPFTPMLFMGEEWAASTPWQFFTSHPDEELGEATAKGRFAEFSRMGWDEAIVPHPQDPETFRRSKLDWSESAEDHHSDILDLYRRLAVIRREHPALTDPRFGRTRVDYDESARWLLLDRGGVQVAFNFSDDEHRVPFLAHAPELLLGTVGEITVEDFGMGACSVTLPPHSAAVLKG